MAPVVMEDGFPDTGPGLTKTVNPGPSPLPATINSLAGEVESLHSIIDSLEARLSKVCCGGAPEEGSKYADEVAEVTGHSEVVRDLQSLTYEVTRARRRLMALFDLLEV